MRFIGPILHSQFSYSKINGFKAFELPNSYLKISTNITFLDKSRLIVQIYHYDIGSTAKTYQSGFSEKEFSQPKMHPG